MKNLWIYQNKHVNSEKSTNTETMQQQKHTNLKNKFS